jgi:membrane dipeptidase
MLNQPIPIVDAHLDLAWNALGWDRDLTSPLDAMRAAERGMTDHPARGHATVCLPEMRRGGVRVCLGTVLCRVNPRNRPPHGRARREIDFANSTIASATALGQRAYYDALDSAGEVRIITTAAQLDEHWRSEEAAAADDDARVGVIVAMEGADPLRSPAHVKPWFEIGLRVLGLAHYGRGTYAVGTGDDGPLTPAGVELLREMRDVGMILDLTHSSDQSFFQAIDLFDGPVLASHNNCRALVPGDRQYSDEQIKLIIARGGVIGAALDSWMLVPNYVRHETPRENVSLEHVADHIDRVCQLAGNSDHAAIGSDLDGGFGTEQTPREIDSIADIQKLAPILAARGYRGGDIANIFHANWLRFFREHLPG